MIPALSLLALAVPLLRQSSAAAELGLVAWERDHDQAFARARSEEKPVLLLFQEIPG